MIAHLKKAKDKVAHILDKFKNTRDCDKTLWLAYLVVFHDLRARLGEKAYQEFKSILLDKETCTMESIRRVRQKYQENGYYLGEKRKEMMAEEDRVRIAIREGDI